MVFYPNRNLRFNFLPSAPNLATYHNPSLISLTTC